MVEFYGKEQEERGEKGWKKKINKKKKKGKRRGEKRELKPTPQQKGPPPLSTSTYLYYYLLLRVVRVVMAMMGGGDGVVMVPLGFQQSPKEKEIQPLKKRGCFTFEKEDLIFQFFFWRGTFFWFWVSYNPAKNKTHFFFRKKK